MSHKKCKYYFSTLLLLLVFTVLTFSQGTVKFAKENRQAVIAHIMRTIAKETGATTSVADSGSGKQNQDMDVTGKLVLKRPDGTVDNDFSSRFIETANKLYPEGDFEPDEHGSIRSKKLDTAVHDAKDAVPDFRSVMPFEEFQSKYIEALQKKMNNPDAYFTAGGNKKQVDMRMQTKSRIRIFTPNGEEEIIVDKKNKPQEYEAAMKKYFGMNPEEVAARAHGRNLFGDAYDAYRQAREPEHEKDPVRGDAKYNTRIVNNLLEQQGLPPWNKLKADQKNEVISRLFPDAAHEQGRATIISTLDRSFSLYMGRSAPEISVADAEHFKAFSRMFQDAAIPALSGKRIQDILNPKVSMRDIYDHSQALAQEEGKVWSELTREERKEYFLKAKENQPELVNKLKFAASAELAAVFKSLDGMDSERAELMKQRIMQNIEPEQREIVSQQIDLARAYLKDESNRKNNVEAEMETLKEIEKIKGKGLVDSEHLNEAKDQQAKGGSTFRKIMMVAGGTYEAYQSMMEKWENLKNNLDPSAQKVAGYLSVLDKTNAIFNLIKIYQETKDLPGGNADMMKRAVYMEAMSRYVPGYSNYQLYKQLNSTDPAVLAEARKSLVFQGLTFLPGGGFAQAVKLTADVMVTGLQITVGYELSTMGDENVQKWLNGTNAYGQSILESVPGKSIVQKRKNFFKNMVTGQGEMVQAYKNLLKEKKKWDRLYPDEKSDPVHQQNYQAKIDAFYKLTQMRIENMVKEYSGKAGMHGEVATGSIGKMTNLLFTDFVNGLNQEVSLEQMKKLEDEAKQANILETADEYLYGLFSQSIDAVLDKMASEDDIKKEAEDSRWNIKFDSVSDDGSIIVSRAQVIPPIDATFEEQNTKYNFAIVDKGSQMEMSGAGAAWKMTKIRIRFKVTNVKGKLIIQKDFTYEPELKGTFTEREYWDPEKMKLKKEYTYYWRSDGKEKIRDGKIRQWFENGTLELEGNYKDNAMDGVLKRYWANGQPYDSTTYNKGTKEGQYQYWNSNGQLEIYGNFKLNRKVGAWVYPEAEGSYLDRFETVIRTYHSDRAIPQDDSKDGLYYEVGTRVSKWIFYSYEIENKRKYKSKEESYNDKGDRQGLSIEYYPNGQKSSECDYVDDKSVSCKSYNEDGSEK